MQTYTGIHSQSSCAWREPRVVTDTPIREHFIGSLPSLNACISLSTDQYGCQVSVCLLHQNSETIEGQKASAPPGAPQAQPRQAGV